MTVEEAISYLAQHTWSPARVGLQRTRQLLAALGNPQRQLHFVHVAGSNGKGSTCAILDSVLRAAGYTVGLYTSPHLQVFGERIRVDGQNIPDDALGELAELVRSAADQMAESPSQFELLTAISMLYFARRHCDLVVLEVGLGGALDSTNVIDAPEAAVLTSIGLEHTEYLGQTLGEIAATKAGIVKPGCPCICSDSGPTVTAVVKRVCQAQSAPLLLVSPRAAQSVSETLDGQEFLWHGTVYRLSLLGRYQLRNAALALETVATLRQLGWAIPESAVTAGLSQVTWPARLELLSRGPRFFLDGGHNLPCAAALAESLAPLLAGEQAVFLMGVLADKPCLAMIQRILPLAKSFVCLTPPSPRGVNGEDLRRACASCGASAVACKTPEAGIKAALDAAGETGAVVCFGSLYLAGQVRSAYPTALRAWLRRAKIRARDALPPETRTARSAAIVERILASPTFQAAHTVMLYKAVRGEVTLSALETAPEARGKRLVYPHCVSTTEMEALLPRGTDAWSLGSFQIPEPRPECAVQIPPDQIDLVLCPCASFDETGARLGMGGGFYDRFLPKCTHAVIAAVAFSVQKAVRLPTEAWDQPMDLVFTEAEELAAKVHSAPSEPSH